MEFKAYYKNMIYELVLDIRNTTNLLFDHTPMK